MAHTPETSDPNATQHGSTVKLGNLTYTPFPDRVVFGPARTVFIAVLIMGSIIGFFAGCSTISALAMAMNILFGWDVLGWKMTASPSSPPAFFGIFILAFSLPFAFLTLRVFTHIVDVIRFWRNPTVFDHSAGVFERGGQKVCSLSDIREVHLWRITDPNYPQQAKMGMAVTVQDGSYHRLEPKTSFLGRRKKEEQGIGGVHRSWIVTRRVSAGSSPQCSKRSRGTAQCAID